MLTLNSLMLVALGVLVASLIVIAILPSYRGRIQRLTADEIKASIPLTEAEIRADKDRLRAQFAIRVHKLEAESEHFKLNAARQRIELNRRDARITELADQHETLRSAMEESANARRVLEHTVTDRLPRLEQQLEHARLLVQDRDAEMASLKGETTRSVRALDEAMQMNMQLRAESERASASMASRATLGPETFTDPKFDGELALRSEIEALRFRTREQAEAIIRLQDSGSGPVGGDVEKLKRELTDAEAALRSSREAAQSGTFDRAAAESQVKSLNARIDAQAGDIARLTAALAVYEGAGEAADGKGLVAGGSRLASKAKLSSLQAQVAQQNDIIQRLRAELAASNERLARQAAHYMEEMRRLGSGTIPTSLDPRRGRDVGPRRGLADRISQAGPRASAPAVVTSTSGDADAAVIDAADALSGNADGVAPSIVDNPAIGADAPKRKLRLMERISGSPKI